MKMLVLKLSISGIERKSITGENKILNMDAFVPLAICTKLLTDYLITQYP